MLEFQPVQKIKFKKYKIKIDTEFNSKGKMNYGEIYLKGESKKEIIISCNICHPSLMSNELSGPAIALYLAKNKKYEKILLL